MTVKGGKISLTVTFERRQTLFLGHIWTFSLGMYEEKQLGIYVSRPKQGIPSCCVKDTVFSNIIKEEM